MLFEPLGREPQEPGRLIEAAAETRELPENLQRVQTLPDPLGRFSSRSIWYAEPLCNDNGQSIDALERLVERHDRQMGRRVLFTEVRPLWPAGPERIALERCGYEFLDYLNFITDVSQPLDMLWSQSETPEQEKHVMKSMAVLEIFSDYV